MLKFVFALLLTISIAFSQTLFKMSSSQELAKAAKRTALQKPEAPEIEQPVDELTYRVGPGDVFGIIIAGQTDEEDQFMVTPEGTLVLPAADPAPVAGLTLKEAKQQIRNALAAKYLTQEVAVSLVQLRSFRVTVSGAVYYPGLVTVNAMSRVSDAVILAGGMILPESLQPEPEETRAQIPGARKPKVEKRPTEEEKQQLEKQFASRRNILVKRRDGSTLRADLLMYETAGITDANPPLLDGDVIVVMPQQKEVGEAAIYGAVRTPGLFEYVPGDRVIDLLLLGRGFRLDADSTKIELARFQSDGKTVRRQEIRLNWDDAEAVREALNFPLQPDDRLFVRQRADFHRKRTVEIRGEVMNPGEYPLLKYPTMLSEVIEMAGGFTSEAMLNGAYVQRRSMEEMKDREFERLDYLISTDMDPFEKAYHRERARELKGLVSVDFRALFIEGKKDRDIALKDKDLIVVPAVENTVYVVGHVKTPGLLPYEPGRSYDYYIKRAGGYNTGAWTRRVRIKKAGTDILLSPNKTQVEMGDMIFVPQRVEKDFWETFRDVAVVTTQIATMVMVITQINYWTSLRK